MRGDIVFVGEEKESGNVAGEVTVRDMGAKEDFGTDVCGTWWDGEVIWVCG